MFRYASISGPIALQMMSEDWQADSDLAVQRVLGMYVPDTRVAPLLNPIVPGCETFEGIDLTSKETVETWLDIEQAFGADDRIPLVAQEVVLSEGTTGFRVATSTEPQ